MATLFGVIAENSCTHDTCRPVCAVEEYETLCREHGADPRDGVDEEMLIRRGSWVALSQFSRMPQGMADPSFMIWSLVSEGPIANRTLAQPTHAPHAQRFLLRRSS